MFFVVDIQRVVVKAGERTNYAAKHGHGVSVVAKPINKLGHRLINHGVVANHAIEFFFLGSVRKLTVEQKVTDFKVVSFFSELINRVTSMQQYAFFAVDVSDV